jgi:type IV secretory pathway VirB3-like protein
MLGSRARIVTEDFWTAETLSPVEMVKLLDSEN